MSGLFDLVHPSDRSEYTSVEDVTFALHDWAVKDKFSFRRAKSSGASWVCATKDTNGCRWKVRAERQRRCRIMQEKEGGRDGDTGEEDSNEDGEEDGEEDNCEKEEEACLYTLVIVHGDHTCHGDAVKTHRSSSSKEWLDGAVARHMRVTKATTPAAIVDMIQVQFLETISEKVALLCKQRLLKSDLAAQRESFTQLPAYERRLQEISPDVYTDLQTNLYTGKCSYS